MIQLKNHVTFETGSPQFRVSTSIDPQAPLYYFYTIENMRADLTGEEENIDPDKTKQIRTEDSVMTVRPGDVIINLISSLATIVTKKHGGFYMTQNFVRLIPDKTIDPKYLVFLLNEDDSIKKQINVLSGNTAIKKLTVGTLHDIRLKKLPDINTQKLIGDIYFKQKRLTYLNTREGQLEEIYILENLKRKGRE